MQLIRSKGGKKEESEMNMISVHNISPAKGNVKVITIARYRNQMNAANERFLQESRLTLSAQFCLCNFKLDVLCFSLFILRVLHEQRITGSTPQLATLTSQGQSARIAHSAFQVKGLLLVKRKDRCITLKENFLVLCLSMHM